jgi:hypothetical protein
MVTVTVACKKMKIGSYRNTENRVITVTVRSGQASVTGNRAQAQVSNSNITGPENRAQAQVTGSGQVRAQA